MNKIVNLCTYFCKKIIAFIFPPFCLGCKSYTVIDQLLCKECVATIKPVISKKLFITKKKYITVYALGKYEGVLQKLILSKKNKAITISYSLGSLVSTLLHHIPLPIHALVPIPLHWTREAYRGYNQSHEICLGIANQKRIPIKKLLIRTRQTKHQTECTALERITNIQNAFKLINNSESRIKNILLVDDVMTSGSTLKEAAKILLNAGYSVNALVVART